MYGIDQDDKIDGGFNVSTLPPGIYKGYNLKKIEFTTTQKNDGSTGKDIINFHFDGPQGPHTHTEWEDDDVKKQANSSKRISHILTKVGITDDTLRGKKTASFKEYATWISNLPIDTEAQVDFKVTAEVWSGKRKIPAFPNYVGFIVKSGEPLSFTVKEQISIEDWKNFKEEEPDREQPNTSATTATPAAGEKKDNPFV